MSDLLRPDIERILRSEPMALTRLGWSYHPPVLDAQGNIRLGYPDDDAYQRLVRAFYAAGVRVQVTNLPNGWIGDGQYRFAEVDRTLDALFSAAPDTYYIPRIRIDPPCSWIAAHPEDACVLWNGPQSLADVRALAAAGRCNGAYDMQAEPEGRGIQPLICDGVIGLQSFSSARWLRDGEEALTQLLLHLEHSPYAERIIGFHLGFGWTGELFTWGRYSRPSDYSTGNARAFFDWGLNKYGGLDALRAAWRLPELTAESPCVPPPDLRIGASDSLHTLLRDTKEGVWCMDYERFLNHCAAHAIQRFAKRAKTVAPGKAVGTFYAYFMGAGDAASLGHLALQPLLDSPYIDYFCSPKSYARAVAGEPGGCTGPQQSIMLKKIWIDEIDNRTHLAEAQNLPGFDLRGTANLEETRAVLWRECCKNESHHVGFWWMDQGRKGHMWYDDAQIMEVVAQLVAAHRALEKMPYQSAAQVLAVIDEESFYTLKNPAGDSPHSGFVRDFLQELSMTGATFDVFRKVDLAQIDTTPYKLVIFLNAYVLPPEEWRRIAALLPRDAMIMWNHLPGVRGEAGVRLSNVRRLCGMSVRPLADGASAYPAVQISAAARPLKAEAGCTRVATCLWKGRRHVLNVRPHLPSADIRAILRLAGVHLYVEEECTVYGDRRFVGLFSRGAFQGRLSLPQPGRYREWITGKEYPFAAYIDVAMDAHDARVFIRMDEPV